MACVALVVAARLAPKAALPLVGVGALIVVALCLFVLPPLIAPPRAPKDLIRLEDLTEKDRIQFADDRRKLQNDVRAALLQAIGGAALLLGLLFTWQQQRATSGQVTDQLIVTQQGQIGERFSRAIEQLGSGTIDIRLGGIYELEQIARQDSSRRLVVADVLAAYIRGHTPEQAASPERGQKPKQARDPVNSSQELKLPAPAPDIQAAMTALGRRQGTRIVLGDYSGWDPAELDPRRSDPRIDLRQRDLRGVQLADADFQAAIFHRSFMTNAMLPRAKLAAAIFKEADLTGADFTDASLKRVDFSSAHLVRSEFEGVDAPNASFSYANLWGASARSRRDELPQANFEGAVFDAANMYNADFSEANLRGAGLHNADLELASLSGAHLEDANIYDALLLNARLFGANLRELTLIIQYCPVQRWLEQISVKLT